MEARRGGLKDWLSGKDLKLLIIAESLCYKNSKVKVATKWARPFA